MGNCKSGGTRATPSRACDKLAMDWSWQEDHSLETKYCVCPLELSFYGRKFQFSSVLRKPTTFLKVKLRSGRDQTVVGTTDTIVSDANPQYTQRVNIEFNFSKHQTLIVEICNRSEIFNCVCHQVIATTEFSLETLVCSLPHEQILSGGQGSLFVTAKEVLKNRTLDLRLKVKESSFQGSHMMRIASEESVLPTCSMWFSSSCGASLTLKAIYLANSFDSDVSPPHPLFQQLTLSLELVNDRDRIVADCRTLLSDLLAEKSISIEGDGKNRIVFSVSVLGDRPLFPMFHLLHNQGAIDFLPAIDFTSSNGDFNDPSSLHYIAQGPSIYEKFIRCLGESLAPYQQQYPYNSFGFGGYLSSIRELLFPLSNTNLGNLSQLIDAYHSALSSCTMAGPAKLSPVIAPAIEKANEYDSLLLPNYLVLFILTDGGISDMDSFISSLVLISPCLPPSSDSCTPLDSSAHSSALPLSVVIIGLGERNFSTLEVLEDISRFENHGERISRPFLFFRRYDPARDSVDGLCSSVLRSLSVHITSYFELRSLNSGDQKSKPSSPLPAELTQRP